MTANPRVLLVEDEEDVAFIVRFLLERNGFEVEHVADGRAALQRIEAGPPADLVLMDMMLPFHDGLELVGRLRAAPAWAGVPVLMLTAKALEADIARAVERGADGYVTKPFQPEELLERVRDALHTAG